MSFIGRLLPPDIPTPNDDVAVAVAAGFVVFVVLGGKSLPIKDIKSLVSILKISLYRFYWSHPMVDNIYFSNLNSASSSSSSGVTGYCCLEELQVILFWLILILTFSYFGLIYSVLCRFVCYLYFLFFLFFSFRFLFCFVYCMHSSYINTVN